MRPGARFAAAALAALALAAPGCKPSSLTPFGLGTRGPDDALGTYSGSWQGSTGGGEVTFLVVSGEITSFVLTHVTDTCAISFLIEDPQVVGDDAFLIEIPRLDPQGSFAAEGRFTSPDTAVGTYRFDALPASAKCPTDGRGTFTAEKLPPPTTEENRP